VPFEARISADGQLLVPPAAATRLRTFAGSTVEVRLTDASLSAALKARGVTDDEVDRIAAAQLESRETAARFLLSEGALRPRGVRRTRR
jgi:hypothetical protein